MSTFLRLSPLYFWRIMFFSSWCWRKVASKTFIRFQAVKTERKKQANLFLKSQNTMHKFFPTAIVAIVNTWLDDIRKKEQEQLGKVWFMNNILYLRNVFRGSTRWNSLEALFCYFVIIILALSFPTNFSIIL